MKKLFVVLALAMTLLTPRASEAYFGAKLGLMDGSNFGYGLAFGFQLPKNFGLDFDLTGYTKSEGSAGTKITAYWSQVNLDLSYDFYTMLLERGLMESIELHPYVKGGGTYAGFAIDAATDTDYRLNHGPGFNFGGGVDWKLSKWFTVGMDLSYAMIFLRGVTISGIPSPATNEGVFSAMAVVKFLAY